MKFKRGNGILLFLIIIFSLSISSFMVTSATVCGANTCQANEDCIQNTCTSIINDLRLAINDQNANQIVKIVNIARSIRDYFNPPIIPPSQCNLDEFVAADGTCQACTANCRGGFYPNQDLSPGVYAFSCDTCSPLSNCLAVTCSDALGSRCAQCDDGYYLNNAGSCDTCQPIADCAAVSCKDGAGSVCVQCLPGQYLNQAGTCSSCKATCPVGSSPSGACDGTSNRDVVNCQQLPNVLINPSFELPLLIEDTLYLNTPIDDWILEGHRWYHRTLASNAVGIPISGTDCLSTRGLGITCPPTDGNQYLQLGIEHRTSLVSTASQVIAPIQPNTVYTFSVDVRTNPSNRAVLIDKIHGTISLGFKKNSVRIILVESEDFAILPHDQWVRVSISFDSSEFAGISGENLVAYLESTLSTALLDNAVLTIDSQHNVAFKPSPVNEEVDVLRDVLLTWQPASDGSDPNLYFGNNYQDVYAGRSSVDKGIILSNNFRPSTIQTGETYYWRVDQIRGVNSERGDIWKFTVADGQAVQPFPLDDKNGISPDIQLDWQPGPYTLTTNGHILYFGTNKQEVEQGTGNTLVGTFSNPGVNPPVPLEVGQTYYWRVDQTDGQQTWTGDVWEFSVFNGCWLGNDFKKGYSLWTESSAKQVFSATRPLSFESTPSIDLSLAINEYESKQLVVLPAAGRQLKNVELIISDLNMGNNIIGKENIEWNPIGYLPIPDYSTLNRDPFFNLGMPDQTIGGWWPDLLLRPVPFDIDEPERAQPIFITVHAPEGTLPGDYQGTITLLTDSGPSTIINLNVHVWNFVLPKGAGTFKSAFAFVEDSAWITPEEYLGYGEFLLQHRLNPDSYSRNSPPRVSDLERFYELGLNSFNILRNRYTTREAIINNFLDELSQSRYAQELRDLAFFYGWDEINSAKFEDMRNDFLFIKTNYPDLETQTTAHVYDLRQNPIWATDPVGELDKYNIDRQMIGGLFYLPDEAALIRQQSNNAKEVWTYSFKFRLGIPNIEIRTEFWRFFDLKTDGVGYVRLNAWTNSNNLGIWTVPNEAIDPKDSPYYPFQTPHKYFNGVLVLPGSDGKPVSTARLNNVRDGLEDYEYLQMIKALRGEAFADQIANRVYFDPDPITGRIWDPAELDTIREEMARIIEQG